MRRKCGGSRSAEQPEESLARFGFTSLDFAGFCKDQKKELNPDKTMTVQNPDGPTGVSTLRDPEPDPVFDEEGNPVYEYSLRYEEFLAMTVKAVQSLYSDNQRLSSELEQVKEEVENLMQTGSR